MELSALFCSVFTLMGCCSDCGIRGSVVLSVQYMLGALAYADDVALLAPTPSAMRRLLQICENYGEEFSVAFNASKSVWMYITRRAHCTAN